MSNISLEQRAFSLVICLLDSKLFELLKQYIGEYDLPSDRTIRRWKNCDGIPKLDESGTNKFYVDTGLKNLITHLKRKPVSEWEESVLIFLKRYDLTLSSNDYKKVLLSLEKKYPRETFNNIEKLADIDIPFYRETQQKIFGFQKKILKEFWSDEDIHALEEKFLKTYIDNELWFFPVLQLFDGCVSIEDFLEYQYSSSVPIKFIEAVQKTRQNITDDPTFSVHKFDNKIGRVVCSTSSYYRALYHCDRYYYHLITNFMGTNINHLKKAFDMSFVWQWQWHLKNIVLLNDFSHIEASIGGSCLFVYYDKTEERYAYLISNKISEANGLGEKHVIPSFMMQPLSVDFLVQHQELDYKKQVYRELLEEVFGEKDFEPNSHNEAIYGEILNNPRIIDLTKLIDDGQAEFHMTGFWLDFYRLRPEITSVMVIHDAEWVEKYLNNVPLGNWETKQGGLIKLYLDDHNTFNQILKGIPNSMCPPGLAAYVKGREKALELISQRT